MGGLGANEWLLVGNSIFSENGKWQNTEEQRSDIKGVKMQDDGNVVIYDNDDKPTWESGDRRHAPNAFLDVQDDGNVVALDDEEYQIWSTDTEM
ncbi:mannose-specific lectin [Fusarium albosuccineum]|uniref:Mannose-specific lectin n=1 Tax=Fusarium albosuccineum TaxID=1237068 RepID=A0A8H4L396_9HYPO|nr:mannose-specific lectin [Fusarium albosuccineum]